MLIEKKSKIKKRRARPVDAMIHLVDQTIDLFNLHFELVIAIQKLLTRIIMIDTPFKYSK